MAVAASIVVKLPSSVTRPAGIRTSFISILRGAGQQIAHFFVASLSEIIVILAYCLKKFRRGCADRFVGFFFNFAASVWRTDRDSHDNSCRAVLSQCLNCSPHRCAGGQSVIHENDDAIAQVRRGSPVAIPLLAPFQLGRLPCRDRLDDVVYIRYRAHDICIQDAHTAGSDRTNGELLETGNTEFAHNKNIKRRAKAVRHFKRNRHAASRETKHKHVSTTGVLDKLLRELPPRFRSVWRKASNPSLCRAGLPPGRKASQKCYNFTLALGVVRTAYCVSARTVTLLLVAYWNSQVVSAAVHHYSHLLTSTLPTP